MVRRENQTTHGIPYDAFELSCWRRLLRVPWNIKNIQCSGGSRTFAKEMEALKMRSIVAGHQKLTATNREHHQCWCSYSYTRSCPRTQHLPFYSCLVFEANWKVKKLSKWMLHELTAKKKKKIHCFEVLSSLNLSSNNETFFDWIVVCNKKGNLYDKEQWPPMSLDWEETPKHFPKANLQQKVSHGHCLLVWSTTAFWILLKPLLQRCILSKLMRCTKN